MKQFKLIILTSLLSVLFVACGDDGSPTKTTRDLPPNTYYDYEECQRQGPLNIGIKGNEACPYKGEYDEEYGYQSFRIVAQAGFNFRLGVGFKIDLGWDNDWENLCPNPGEVPVFRYDQFSHCIYANPTYGGGRGDGINTSPCTGSQYNPEVTGCTPRGVRPRGGSGYYYID